MGELDVAKRISKLSSGSGRVVKTLGLLGLGALAFGAGRHFKKNKARLKKQGHFRKTGNFLAPVELVRNKRRSRKQSSNRSRKQSSKR